MIAKDKVSQSMIDAVNAVLSESEQLDEGMPLAGHPYHSKSDAELKYIQKDAGEAAKAMKGHDSKAEAKYLDQVNDASTVLFHRKNGGKQIAKEDCDEAGMYAQDQTDDDNKRQRKIPTTTKPANRAWMKSADALLAASEKGIKEEHDDEAEDKKLIKTMVKKKALKNEDVEQIDELSPDTLNSYMKKTKKKISNLRPELGHREGGKIDTEIKKLSKNYRTAWDKRDKVHKEDVEQIDELSKKTLKSYMSKAKKSHDARGRIESEFRDMAATEKSPALAKAKNKVADMAMKKKDKRSDGMEMAKKRLAKEDFEPSAFQKRLLESEWGKKTANIAETDDKEMEVEDKPIKKKVK